MTISQQAEQENATARRINRMSVQQQWETLVCNRGDLTDKADAEYVDATGVDLEETVDLWRHRENVIEQLWNQGTIGAADFT